MYRPSKTINSSPDRGSADAGHFGPFRHASRHVSVSQYAVRSRVASLLRLGSPVAVILAVSLGVFASFDGVLVRWATAHVGDKRGEGLGPFVANIDPATSVPTMIPGRPWVCASRNHSSPDLVLRGTGESVRIRQASSGVSSKAATAFGVAIPQELGVDKQNTSTLASTLDLNSRPSGQALVKNCQPTTFGFGLNRFRGRDTLAVSHDMTFRKQRWLWLEPVSRSKRDAGSFYFIALR